MIRIQVHSWYDYGYLLVRTKGSPRRSKTRHNYNWYQRASTSLVHPAPKNPVLDITECRGEEVRFFHKVWYRPKVVVISLREVHSDDLWSMWAVVVKSRRFMIGICSRKVKVWRGVGDLRGPFDSVIGFLKLQRAS